MKYVITENETGVTQIFDTFIDVMKYIDKWHGDDETSTELKYKKFHEYHSTTILDLGFQD
jgi:hypothetical protein